MSWILGMLTKTRRWMAIAVAIAGACIPAAGQTSINGVRIATQPENLAIDVDGRTFTTTQNFAWPEGSKHNVSAPFVQYGFGGNARYTLDRWVTNLENPNFIATLGPITASPGLKSVTAVYKVEYALGISYHSCAPDDAGCYPGGVISVNGAPYDRDTVLWFGENATVTVEAYPRPGFVFTGWGTLGGNSTPTTNFATVFRMSRPQSLTPRFQIARPVTVNVETAPPNLEILVDRTPLPSPANVEWGWGTVHSLGSFPVQRYNGEPYVFQSWSDGGAINHDVNVPESLAPITFVANFVPGATISFLTSPPGLKLRIDGRDNWQNYTFVWAAGEKHPVIAPAEQVDARGRKYRFVSWSNGASATQQYTVQKAPDDVRVTAVFEAVGQVTLASAPAGIDLQVDGATCRTPCVIERAAGAQVRAVAPPVLDAGEGSRLVLQDWGSGGETAQVFVVSEEPQTRTATYRLQHRLSLDVIPANGAGMSVLPAGSNGFHDADSQVTVTAELNAGFRVVLWEGDVSGKGRSVVLSMNGPRRAVLRLEAVPHLKAAAVRNAAIEQPAPGVAPGSLISVFGLNLAGTTATGPANPLAQTLAGVTVRVNDLFLPLVFVSPEQINAQIRSEIAEGEHILIVRREGYPEVSTPIVVVRNAPGLFTRQLGDRQFAVALHQDGRPITPEDPAHAGELVSMLGTGFGGYRIAPPDGFILPEGSGYDVGDEFEVVAGEDRPALVFAGRSGAGAGVDAFRFRVPAALSGLDACPVKIRVGGQNSNEVLLPIGK